MFSRGILALVIFYSLLRRQTIATRERERLFPRPQLAEFGIVLGAQKRRAHGVHSFFGNIGGGVLRKVSLRTSASTPLQSNDDARA
mmetsp:Transcript_32724/g.111106  ORF Transcript_32724/g.111106 Transcript_32724/m.111106 type:complete len:86 (+) Transcript_32724:661-918(+)